MTIDFVYGRTDFFFSKFIPSKENIKNEILKNFSYVIKMHIKETMLKQININITLGMVNYLDQCS